VQQGSKAELTKRRRIDGEPDVKDREKSDADILK
jgi:hypothetical protein